MREEDVLQVLGGSFFNSVLVDIEKNTYTRMNFAPWLLKISQTGMYTGLADFIVCNSAVEEYKESLKKDLSLESIETFFNSRDPEERDEENSITYEAEVVLKRKPIVISEPFPSSLFTFIFPPIISTIFSSRLPLPHR